MVTGASESDIWTDAEKLRARQNKPKWDRLSWTALRVLISSTNAGVNMMAPLLVSDLRTRWMAGRRGSSTAGAGHPGLVVDRTGTESFIVLGDTGEQDASQYVVVPALRRALAEQEPQPEFMVICSDVIYPSGDVNDYVHALYLPYGPDPAAGGAADALSGLPIYGLPGNHDWYDGLNGFMTNFCDDAAPLPASAYGWPRRPQTGSSSWLRNVREGVGRMLWRRPSAPVDAPLWKGGEDEPHTELKSILNHRADRSARLPAAQRRPQPGSYYAIETRHLIVICIDGGIGSGGHCAVDHAQGEWLMAVSAWSPKPKVLLTGYPLLVNQQWRECRIEWRPGTPADRPATVNAIVADPANNYVASIGGDIHNYQHYRVQLRPGDAAADHTVDYLVSGGGGAYMSATHPVSFADEIVSRELDNAEGPGTAQLRRTANGLRGAPTPTSERGHAGRPTAQDCLGPAPLAQMPSPEESLSHYSGPLLVLIRRFLVLLVCLLGGTVIGALLLEAWHRLHPTALRVTELICCAALGIGLAAVYLLPRKVRRRHVELARRVYEFAALLAGVAVTIGLYLVDNENWYRELVVWACLTAAGGTLAWLMRASAWWREPARHSGLDVRRLLQCAAVVALASAFYLYFFWDDEWLRWTYLGIVAVAVLGLAGRWIWPSRWRRIAPVLAYTTQGVAALGVLVHETDSQILLGAVLGLPVLVALVVVSVIVVAVVRAVAAVMKGGPGDWRASWGEVSGIGLGAIGALVVAGLAAGFWFADDGWFAATTELSFLPPVDGASRGMLTSATVVVAVVLVVVLIDGARRVFPWAYRGVVPVLAAVAAGLIWWSAQTRFDWVPRALAASLIVTLLGLITVALANVAFLGLASP